jgi:DNA-3-methyladenine glycosylase
MSATRWEWRSSSYGGNPSCPPEGFFRRDAATVARDLLGCSVLSKVDGVDVEGVIVETEAYVGPHDPASHSAERIGKTERNASMFGPPGHAYVFRSYGIHWCLNVVTNDPGYPAAVLIRALDPIRGLDRMLDRRGGNEPICAGPGRLAQALGVSGDLDGHPLWMDPLRLLSGWSVPDDRVGISGRIGVREASNWPLRFFVRGHPEVSRKS